MTDPTGAQILALGLEHEGENYRLGVLTPKRDATYHGPWDCAELASWLLEQAGVPHLQDGRIYGCSVADDAYTGTWEEDAHHFGRIIALGEAATIAGAFVLRVPGSKGGHIVISDGAGGTIEAHSKARGVIRSTLQGRRWDFGVLPPGIAYAPGSPAVVLPPRFAILCYGDTGATVRVIQRELGRAGFDPGLIDGVFGSRTQAAVIAFQAAHGLVADGEVGSATAAALGVPLPLA